MGYRLLLFFLLVSSTLFSQEIGSILDGDYLIEIHKNNNIYSCFYTDVYSESTSEIKSFEFPNIDRIYTIIMDGFDNSKDHKTYVLTNKDTIVKFEFNKINGEVKLKIKHNNLTNNIIGSTTYLNKEQIKELFGTTI